MSRRASYGDDERGGQAHPGGADAAACEALMICAATAQKTLPPSADQRGSIPVRLTKAGYLVAGP
jgi:hypothetical protein